VTHPSSEKLENSSLSHPDVAGLARSHVPDLCSLAANGLVTMLDTERQLFCYRVKQTPQGMVREGISHRYTMMSLLGLHRFEAGGLRSSPINIDTVFEALVTDLAWLDNLGDLGLILWLCAVIRPDFLKQLYAQLDVRGAPARLRGARKSATMELAWLLSGLSHASLAARHTMPGLAELAAETYSLLQSNQGEHGFFRHLTPNGTLASALRGRIGSFADQVYPIYAFSKFGQALQNRAALDSARRCAEAICHAQGSLGQWWWHYDSLTGRIVQKYPVYSVHQHGMAPMSLFALTKATRVDFRGPIFKGLAWINGTNEFETTLRSISSSLVWRSAYRPGNLKMYVREFRDFLTSTDQVAPPSELEIKFECRPYELGWLLYAFCGEDCN
jgi:hypothetical protein